MAHSVSFLVLLALLRGSVIYGQSDTMNGYSLKQYEGFEKNWRLVTVRYRKDTGEMRLTYANELAWKTLSEGRINYPKGAVFAKIGVKTESDPAFAASLSPEGTRKRVERWRTGFYWIAQKAGMPILPVTFDFSRREVRLFPLFMPTGDAEADLLQLRAHFSPEMAHDPSKYVP